VPRMLGVPSTPRCRLWRSRHRIARTKGVPTKAARATVIVRGPVPVREPRAAAGAGVEQAVCPSRPVSLCCLERGRASAGRPDAPSDRYRTVATLPIARLRTAPAALGGVAGVV